jgi:hypothetical protein
MNEVWWMNHTDILNIIFNFLHITKYLPAGLAPPSSSAEGRLRRPKAEVPSTLDEGDARVTISKQKSIRR